MCAIDGIFTAQREVYVVCRFSLLFPDHRHPAPLPPSLRLPPLPPSPPLLLPPKVAVAIIEETSKAVGDMPVIMAYPVIHVITATVNMAWFLFIGACLMSAGDISLSSVAGVASSVTDSVTGAVGVNVTDLSNGTTEEKGREEERRGKKRKDAEKDELAAPTAPRTHRRPIKCCFYTLPHSTLPCTLRVRNNTSSPF